MQGIDVMTFFTGENLPQTVLLATHNAGKVRELQEALLLLGWRALGAEQLGLPIPEETGTTYRANALLKAQKAAVATGYWALADDSGLEVAALNGAPGVDTAHYGGWERLLETLKGVNTPLRKARFVCVLALVSPGGEAHFFEGTCEGRIALEAMGDGGFGYDPVFVPEGESRTFATMSKAEKQRFSHRGKALSALLCWVQDHTNPPA